MTLPGRLPDLCLSLLTIALALPAAAFDLALPDGAERMVNRADSVTSFRIATGVFDGDALPSRTVDGALLEEVWHVPGAGDDIAGVYATMRAQLTAQGYEIGFSCADRDCGGFDFRFGLPIAQGPEMYVDLGNFRYLTARRETASGAESVALTLSAGGMTGYLHIARVGEGDVAPAAIQPQRTEAAPAPVGDLIGQLTGEGHAVLDDLTFRTGASALSGNRYDSLAALAAWLAEDGARRVALVGHTDASGSQDANAALSRARAEAVRAALITNHGSDADQVIAAGVGFLAPRATNSTPAGREANRRVEVVLLSQ